MCSVNVQFVSGSVLNLDKLILKKHPCYLCVYMPVSRKGVSS